MFCPECRKYWDAPQKADEARGVKRAKQRTRCSVCGSFLAQDRLIAEFPPAVEGNKSKSRSKERRLTVSEILRATAGPSPVASFKAATVEEQTPGVRRGWTGFPRTDEPESEIEWYDDESPVIPRNFGKPKRRIAIRTAFDFALVALVVGMIIAVTVHAAIGFERATAISSAPTAAIVKAINLGTPAASADTLPLRITANPKAALPTNATPVTPPARAPRSTDFAPSPLR